MKNPYVKYIKVYDDALDATFCKNLIDKFEMLQDKQVVTELEGVRHFTEINLARTPEMREEFQFMQKQAQQSIQQYVNDCGIEEGQWQQNSGFEEFRMKRYEANGKDEFSYHVDVQDYASARRYLVFFWYLNTVEEGGETYFHDIEQGVNPIEGRLLMFPPMWTYPHAGLMPKSGTKYIVGGYLHYL